MPHPVLLFTVCGASPGFFFAHVPVHGSCHIVLGFALLPGVSQCIKKYLKKIIYPESNYSIAEEPCKYLVHSNF